MKNIIPSLVIVILAILCFDLMRRIGYNLVMSIAVPLFVSVSAGVIVGLINFDLRIRKCEHKEPEPDE